MKNLFNKGIINKKIAIPLYFQIKTHIENNIKNGQLSEGDMLPSEDELSRLLDVSRPTVRQALNELSAAGYLERKRAKGTCVTRPKIYKNYLSKLESFYHEMIDQGQRPVTKVISLSLVDNDETVAGILGCKSAVYLERVRYIDSKPVLYIESWLPATIYSGLLDIDMENNSLYDQMKELKNPVVRVERLISAIAAETRDAQLMDVPRKSPLLLSVTTGYDAQNKPVEYSLARYKGSSHKFRIELFV
ncbi:MAG: GntR family transcriptional regulator [Kluyvera sp.]|uniref:GntR family transcriptional regulator n=1 Tax=Kluyvera sp. TaxID=1538228 RepID=UPI003F412B34